VGALAYCPVVDYEGRGSGHHRDRLDLDPEPADDVDRHKSSATSSSSTLEQTLAEIRHYLRQLAAAAGTDGDADSRQGAGPSHSDLVVGEWQHVALVIDRVSFALFSLISVIVTIAMLH